MRNKKVDIGTDLGGFLPGRMIVNKDNYYKYFNIHGQLINDPLKKRRDQKAKEAADSGQVKGRGILEGLARRRRKKDRACVLYRAGRTFGYSYSMERIQEARRASGRTRCTGSRSAAHIRRQWATERGRCKDRARELGPRNSSFHPGRLRTCFRADERRISTETTGIY